MATTTTRSYPYDAWVLTPSYAPKAITIVKSGGMYLDLYDRDENGKSYGLEQLHASKAAAISYGRQQIAARLEYLAKQEMLLGKRTAKLDKAEEK